MDEEQPLGVLLEQRRDLIDQKRALEVEIGEIKDRINDLDVLIMARMDDVGLDQAAAEGVMFTIKEAIVPSVRDWDQVYQYIKDNEAWYLLQRRMTTEPYRELHEQGQNVPGVEPYLKRTVLMTRRR